jgi:hypothetical protein
MRLLRSLFLHPAITSASHKLYVNVNSKWRAARLPEIRTYYFYFSFGTQFLSRPAGRPQGNPSVIQQLAEEGVYFHKKYIIVIVIHNIRTVALHPSLVKMKRTEDVQKMNIDELCQWLKPGLDEEDWNNVDQVIRNQRIRGKNFLNLTKADWKSDGLPGGIADSLVQIAQGVLGGGGASANDFVDVSFELYQHLTTPFNSEPKIDELPALLRSDPLVKFPVNPPSLKVLENIIPIPIIERLFRSSTSEYCNIYGNLFNLAQMTVKLDSDAKSTLHFYVDSLVKEVLEKLLAFSGFDIHTSRKVTDFSSTTEPRTCPDFLFYVNNFLILRGEEKKRKEKLGAAKTELVDKLRKSSVITFGKLKYIIGFACAGEHLTFCAISSSVKLFNISRIFNLESVFDRFEIVICLINLARLFRTLAHLIPKETAMMYKTKQRPNGYCTIEIRDDYVRKTIPVSIHEFEERYEYLDSLYTIMLREKVPHVIECWRISKSPKRLGDIRYILLKLKPCGLQIVPSSLNLLRSALRSVLLALEGIHKLGYAHCDVRWPNILYVTDEDWRLIDFENSSWGDSSLMKNDLRMVGKLMSRCGSLVLSSELLSLREQLISETPPAASEALEILDKEFKCKSK